MKTVLINIFDTVVAKNIFMPPFQAAIRENTGRLRYVVMVPSSKMEEFSRDYGVPNLSIVPRPQRYATGLENAALFIARNSIPTHTVRQIQEEGLDGSGRLPLGRYLVARLFWILGHSALIRRLLKRALARVFDTTHFERVLDEHTPDLIFATSTYAVDDVRLLKLARERSIPTLGLIKSWDNLSSKDFLIVEPDHLLVHNRLIRREVEELHAYPSERIHEVGVPQFDWYADPTFCLSREEFFRQMGLDPTKKLITYTAMGTWIVPHERDIIALLNRIVQGGVLKFPVQLLVRMHPAYPDAKDELRRLFPAVIVDEPGSPLIDPNNTWKADWKFSLDDVRRLATTLKHSDVTINCGSTMILDAACIGTPIIGIAFDGEAVEPSYWRSARRLFQREHCKAVAATGGVRVVGSEKELIAELDAYLADKTKDTDGRERIVREQTKELGNASASIARTVIDIASSL